MTFIIESTQYAVCVCREIILTENSYTPSNKTLVNEQQQRLQSTLKSLLSLIDAHKSEIGAMHIFDLCSRFLGLARMIYTRQLIISVGIMGLSQLLSGDISNLRVQECADIFNKLFSLLPESDKLSKQPDCPELISALSSCKKILSPEYISDETRSTIINILERFILNFKVERPYDSEDTLASATNLYYSLLSKEPLNMAIFSTIFNESTDVEHIVKALTIACHHFSEEELNAAISVVIKRVFSSSSISAHAILCLCELLYNLKDSRIADLFGLLIDGLVRVITNDFNNSTTTMNIETADRALSRPLEKLERNQENFDALYTYLQSGDNSLRDAIASYILDSLLTILNSSEMSESNTAILVLLYLELLAQTDIYESIFYTNDLYIWLVEKFNISNSDDPFIYPYWYEHSLLMGNNCICTHCPQVKNISPTLAAIVQIVSKELPTHMLSQVIEVTSESTFSRVLFLGNALIFSSYYTDHEFLIKELLTSFNTIMHYHPIPSIVELVGSIISTSLSTANDISTDKALLLILCVFYRGSPTKVYQHDKIIEECSAIAIEYLNTVLFEAFHLSTDALGLSIKSLLVILITSLNYAPISSLPLITGIRDILISRWNKIVAMEGPVFTQTNVCLYISLLSIVEYYKRKVDPIILIVNTYLQEYSNLDMFQELPSMNYPQDLTEEGFNRYNDGENVAVLTSFGHALLIGDWCKYGAKLSSQHISVLSCFGDSLALSLPILIRGLCDTLHEQDSAHMVLVSLHNFMHTQIKASLQLFSLSKIPLPYKLAYRIDPYHDAMMPRGYKSNDPRAEDQTYNLLLSLRMKASTLFVDDEGKTRLQAADTDWLALFKNGHEASRIILHNCFDAFFFRAQQAAISKQDRLLLIGGLSFAEYLFDLDAEYLQSKKLIISNTLHHLLFCSSIIPPPHILYLLQHKEENSSFKASFTDILSLVCPEGPYTQKILANLEKNKTITRLIDVSVGLFSQTSQDFSETAPPTLVLDILSFFCCRHHNEKIISTAHSIVKMFIAKYIPWDPKECPPEETIEGAAERLPIYENEISIKQGDIKQWAKDVLATEELFTIYKNLDIQSPNSSNGLLLQQYLNPAIWQAYSSAVQNAIEVLGKGRDAQTFVEQKHSNLERQRMCLYILIDNSIKQTLQSFIKAIN